MVAVNVPTSTHAFLKFYRHVRRADKEEHPADVDLQTLCQLRKPEDVLVPVCSANAVAEGDPASAR